MIKEPELYFDSLTICDVEVARKWRNNNMYALRTPFMLTSEQQIEFYNKVICDRSARSRFWAVRNDDNFIAMTGLENIEWENGIAEISIIVDTLQQSIGNGSKIVDLLLDQGFNSMGLNNIYGECYDCNPAYDFWRKLARRYNMHTTLLPYRKLHKGRYHDSLYFSITNEQYNLYKEGNKK